ncbi:hypothetical protein ES705_13603 [subsurface metagenome]
MDPHVFKVGNCLHAQGHSVGQGSEPHGGPEHPGGNPGGPLRSYGHKARGLFHDLLIGQADEVGELILEPPDGPGRGLPHGGGDLLLNEIVRLLDVLPDPEKDAPEVLGHLGGEGGDLPPDPGPGNFGGLEQVAPEPVGQVLERFPEIAGQVQHPLNGVIQKSGNRDPDLL